MSLLRSLRPPRGFSMPAFLSYLAVIILVALVPQLTRKPLILHMWIMIFLAISQGAAWNVIGGYTGQYSVGHAAYFGIGAYTTMMLLELHQIAPWYGIGFLWIIEFTLQMAPPPAALRCGTTSWHMFSVPNRLNSSGGRLPPPLPPPPRFLSNRPDSRRFKSRHSSSRSGGP